MLSTVTMNKLICDNCSGYTHIPVDVDPSDLKWTVVGVQHLCKSCSGKEPATHMHITYDQLSKSVSSVNCRLTVLKCLPIARIVTTVVSHSSNPIVLPVGSHVQFENAEHPKEHEHFNISLPVNQIHLHCVETWKGAYLLEWIGSNFSEERFIVRESNNAVVPVGTHLMVEGPRHGAGKYTLHCNHAGCVWELHKPELPEGRYRVAFVEEQVLRHDWHQVALRGKHRIVCKIVTPKDNYIKDQLVSVSKGVRFLEGTAPCYGDVYDVSVEHDGSYFTLAGEY